MYAIHYPAEIIFGIDSAEKLFEIISKRGLKRPLLLVSKSVQNDTNIGNSFIQKLKKESHVVVYSDVPTEAPLDALQTLLETVRGEKVDAVIGLGGGTVLDSAKLLAAVIPTTLSLESLYFGHSSITQKGLPMFALPTTAGTGAEITRNGVFLDTKSGQKQSIRHESMIPDVAIIDPRLTLSCPKTVSVYSGLDAFVQAVESYFSKNANPLTQQIAQKAIEILLRTLPLLPTHLDDLNIRAAMAEGSLFSAMAFSQSGLGAVHALAHPIGGKYHVPHGKICAMLLLPVLKLNRTDTHVLETALGLQMPFIHAVENMLQFLEIPADLKSLKLPKEAIPFVVQNSRSNSMKSNPRELSDAELVTFLEGLL